MRTRHRILRPLIFSVALVCCLAAIGYRSEPVSYIERFEESFPRRIHTRDLSKFASVELYDQRFLEWEPESLDNDRGDLAWSFSYRMAGLNEMFKATDDPRYLVRNKRFARKVLGATDKARGLSGAPTWSSSNYNQGQSISYLVHTAMICYPILELLHLQGGANDGEDRELLLATLEALHYHEAQWRDGPAKNEGYYVYPKGQNPERAGQVLPINRLSAAAKCHWLEWKLTGDEEAKRKAEALARYFKNRLQLGKGGGYVWSYNLPRDGPSKELLPEDVSHAALTASLVPLMAADDVVFDQSDLIKFAATLHHGILSDESGVIFGDVQGSAKSDPRQVALPARWLEFSPYHRAIYSKLARHYEEYDTDPNPHRQSLAVALLIRFRPDGTDR